MDTLMWYRVVFLLTVGYTLGLLAQLPLSRRARLLCWVWCLANVAALLVGVAAGLWRIGF